MAFSVPSPQAQGAPQQVPSRNVNVISGTGPDGDWTLQRQNEPSGACSSRNPLNCLVGANDYRSVDIPFPPDADRVIGDAWLGWYTTKDGGQTWRTRLLPGFPQDVSPEGLGSPLKGMDAGADPVVRAGANGLFFYAGIAFSRAPGGGSRVFVARFIDHNNRERPDVESIQYLDTAVIQDVPAGSVSNFFVDKPWLAVDIPRAGARRCRIGGRNTGLTRLTLPCSRVYLAYTVFTGEAPNQRGTIVFSYSDDSGATWSAPQPIRLDPDVDDDGVVNATDLQQVRGGRGQRCQTAGYQGGLDVNLDCAVDSRDANIVSRLVGTPVPNTAPLDQGATLALAPLTGQVHVAWRQFGLGNDPHAIVATRSADGGVTFAPPAVVATIQPFDQGTSLTSFRSNAFPSMTVDAAGRSYLAWTTRGLSTFNPDPVFGDARVVVATSPDGLLWSANAPVDNHVGPGHQFMPSLVFAAGKLQLLYYDQREDLSQVYARFVDESQIDKVRHTTEVRVATAAPADQPAFESLRVSDYVFGLLPGSSQLQQLQFDPPNLKLFRQGTTPFIGDYIEIFAAQPIISTQSGPVFNTAPAGSPLFHAVWTDNRDVRPPPDGDWTKYAPPIPSFPRPTTSAFEPGTAIPPCVPGFVATRNQNIYTARVTGGLVAAALTNAKQLGAIQRSFPIYVQNATRVRRSYRISIRTQPVGGVASLQQFSTLTTLDVSVAALSTAARTVYVTSTDPRASVPIDVIEIDAPGGTPIAGGQSGEIVLNPDPTNPDVENPDVENPDVENPDVENPDVENVEVYNPDVENGAVLGVANPDVENPDVENPDVENTLVMNPSVITPDVENPDVENPDVENPDVENPDVENLDLVNGGLTDTTWTMTNRGNTAASYSLKMLLNRGFPVGFRSQLLVHRTYQTPTVQNCELKQQTQNVLLVNISDPSFTTLSGVVGAAAGARATLAAATSVANPDVENPSIDNVTVAIAPGESIVVTLRVYDPDRSDAVIFDALSAVTPAMVAQAVDTVSAAAGVTAPAVAAPVLLPATPPAAAVGQPYAYTLPATDTGTWSVVGGMLPGGLTLDSSTGAITGTATTGGTFTFVTQFVSSSGIVDYQTVTITVAGAASFADLSVSTSAGPDPGTIGQPLTYTTTVSNLGPSPASNVTLTQSLPLGLTALSITPAPGMTCTTTTFVSCTMATLGASGSAVITITVTPGAAGFAASTATVASATGDGNVSNNSASVSTLISGFAACATPTLSPPRVFDVPASGNFALFVEDMNRDGNLDVVMSHRSSSEISLLLGDGTGNFAAPILLSGPAGQQGLAIADFNEDGNPDIVAGTSTSPNLSLYLGDGAGGFSPPSFVPAIATFVPEPGDFNNDGNVDLVVGGFNNGQMAFLAGSGDGTFAPAVVTTIGTGIVQLVLDDYNLDGKLDLATSGAGIGPAGSIGVYLGDGLGGFTAGTTVTLGTNARVRQGLGDVNLDGNPDLAVTTGAGGTANAQTFILFGDGAGGFAAPLDIQSGPFSQYTTAGDLTGDGLPDVVTVHPIAGGVGVQIGAGNAFGPSIMFAVSDPVHVRLVDINRDKRPDVLTASSDGPSLYVLLNNCGAPSTNLSLAASDSPDPVAPGAVLTYSIAVTNNGPNPATGVVISGSSDADGLDLVSLPVPSVGSCTVGEVLTCDIGTMAVNDTVTLIVDTTTIAGGSTLPLTVSVAANEADPDTTDNGQTLLTTVTVAPLTFTVTSTGDDFSQGTLRRAIDDANLNLGALDTIAFNIPGGGPHTIQVLSPLPTITSPIVIDGTTQPGYAGAPIIELNGVAAGGGVTGLNINAGGSTIRGLAINRFGGHGINLFGAGGNVIEGNYIGTNLAGTAAAANGFSGVSLLAPNTTVGGFTAAARNVISGNTRDGVTVGAQLIGGVTVGSTGAGSVIVGNYLGTNAAGTAAIAPVSGANGVAVRVPNVTVGAPGAGNVISGNGAGGSGSGVQANVTTVSGTTTILTLPTGLVVQSNLIGTNAAGTAAVPNNVGVSINAGSGQIGGTAAGAGNVISGNTSNGVFLTLLSTNIGGTNTLVTQSSNVVVEGNLIGLDSSGTAALPNGTASGHGISVVTSNHFIGGTTSAARNVISGNGSATGGSGISISGNATFGIVASNNSIRGNYVGLNAAGTAVVGNQGTGISVSGNNNAIGGEALNAGNVISGNGAANNGGGVGLNGGTGNLVKGNRIGTNPAGTAAMPNQTHGISINNSSNNLIGGAAPGARNLLSGNGTLAGFGGNGVVINNGTGNEILGNYIGTDVTGNSALPNTAHGIGVFSGAIGTVIGGVHPGEGNLISGNGVLSFGGGVVLGGGSSTVVRGNLIGTNAAGTAAIPNRASGVAIPGSNDNIIGGTTAAARNVVSGNGIGATFSPGINVFQTSSGNQILGNYIGTDITGAASLPNNSSGVFVGDTASNNVIGGAVPGAGNVISGNGNNGQFAPGVQLAGGGSHVVQGNLIGVNAAGVAALPNTHGGVSVASSNDNVIGGATAPSRNVIAGNGSATSFGPGVSISGGNGTQILGNYIGTDITGTTALPNSAMGIQVSGTASGTQLGGTNAGEGNVISGNGTGSWFAPGISLTGGSATTIQGNLIGTNAAGTAAIANRNDGINVGVSSNNVIGGSTAAARNVLSGNGSFSGSGVWLETGATGNQVLGNYIGSDLTGTAAIANSFAGVRISGANNIVGGGSGGGNLLSGNTYGVYIGTPSATGNQVLGNRIGTDAAGTAALANTSHGIFLDAQASNTLIGGSGAGDANIVAFNASGGVVLAANEGDGHQVSRNSIFDNGALGIDLGGDGADANDAGDADTGPNDRQNSPVLTTAVSVSGQTTITGTFNSTPSASFTLEFFSNTACDPSGRGEGRTFIGSVVVNTDGAGDATINSVFPVATTGLSITATATSAGNSTSEFSNCVVVTP